MIKALAEKHVETTTQNVLGPQAFRALKGVNKLAARQGGSSVVQNYQLLGMRSLMVVGAAIVVVHVGGMAVSMAVSNKIQKRQIEKAVAKALEQERQREQGEAGREYVEKAECGRKEARRGRKARRRAGKTKAKTGSGKGRDSDAEGDRERSFYKRFGKRACDVAVSLVALPVVGAVTVACGVAIRAEDAGPVFYNAPRVGKDGREFIMYKLRSMKVDSPDLVMEDGSTYNGADDPRMTNVGRFMRKTSLDEIPQFLNVLKGDMSVVGPRPDLKRETELYQGDESLKLTVKPGVTGYAAVYGRNSLPWHDRLALDVHYVRNLSFPLDAKVFFKTFSTVFSQDGVFVEPAQASPALS